MRIKAILTGATGMAGEGVLHECLLHPDVGSVLVIGRRPCGVAHSKLKEIIHNNFFDLSGIESQLSGYDACFFCAGISSIGMKEQDFYHVTYELTLSVAKTLSRLNPQMTFCYVSGSGTDGTEKGRSMWARVKGKTENDLLRLPFKSAYMFRPGYMQPTKGLKNTLRPYRMLSWLYPALRGLFPSFVCTLKELGLAMIHVAERGYRKPILEVKDVVELAKES